MLQVPFAANDTNRATARSSDVSGYEVVSLKGAITGDKTTLRLPLHLLHPHTSNPEFRGREDVLRQLDDALLPTESSSADSASAGLQTFALCGIGGLGKTQIAVQFAYNNLSTFDAVFVLQASEAAKLFQAFSEISKRLGLEEESSTGDQIVSRDLVLGWLSQPVHELYKQPRQTARTAKREPKWLLIFDNADDLGFLRDFWPVSGTGSVLITSRDPLAKTRTHVPVSQGLDLEPFDVQTAGNLLRHLTGHEKESDISISQNIAHRLSGHPLAISQISGTISRRDLSLEEFSELYDKESLRADFHQSSLEPTSKTLWTILSFEDLTPYATVLLQVIAFLDPDSISEDLLFKMKEVENNPASASFPNSLGNFMEARTELSKSSLVKRNRDRRELIVHRIIQDVARARMDEPTLRSIFGAAVDLLYHAWPFSEFEHSTERWLRCEPMIGHIANLHRLYHENTRLQQSEDTRPKLARLFMDMGW